jgi:hypothetical protein
MEPQFFGRAARYLVVILRYPGCLLICIPFNGDMPYDDMKNKDAA